MLSEKDHAPEALGFDAQMKPLDIRIQVGTLCRQSHRIRAGVFQDRSKGRAEVGIAIHQDILAIFQETIERIAEVPGDLLHEIVTKGGRSRGPVNASSRKFHDEQQIVGDEPPFVQTSTVVKSMAAS